MIWRPQATGNPQLDEILREIMKQINDLQAKVQNLQTSVTALKAKVGIP